MTKARLVSVDRPQNGLPLSGDLAVAVLEFYQ